MGGSKSVSDAGWMDEEYRAYGYDFPEIPIRLKQFEEGLQILKLMLGPEEAVVQGQVLRDQWRDE